MERELCKAWTGFKTVEGHIVATGHWGCGVFGGDPNIKCLVQVMAASMAGLRQLDFYCFNDQVCSLILIYFIDFFTYRSSTTSLAQHWSKCGERLSSGCG